MTAATAALSGWSSFAAARDSAVRQLRGRVLELGAGRGANFAQLADGVEWVGLEPSRQLRPELATNARHHGHHAPVLSARGEAIPLEDSSVDAVLGTMVLCSVQDPARTLSEAYRVLAPGGHLVLAEHVAAPRGSGTRILQHLARPWTRLFDRGCDPARETEAAVRSSAFEMSRIDRFRVPIIGGLSTPLIVVQASKPLP